MKRYLFVIDYQNDFVDGALGFPGAEKLDAGIAAKIREYCDKQERCEECPLFVPKSTETCYMATNTPERWDPDEIIYMIGYKAGKGES